MSTRATANAGPSVGHCPGCGQPRGVGEHAECERRQRATDPPRFCEACGRKLVVQVLPVGWIARCVKCGPPGVRT